MASGCLDEEIVIAFLAGGLAAAERSVVARHLEACVSCAEVITWAAADQAYGGRSVSREGRPFLGQLAPGSRIDRYQILEAVGRGGMGEVYAAYHPDLDRRIALKVVAHDAGGESDERRTRLLREARAIARLSHPNVVAVHDAGAVDDRVYIAMEFVAGETADVWLKSKRRTWREILDVFIAAGRGLAAAHAAGIIHRDFKPQNVMVGRDGSVRVMDFGLARLAEEPADAGAATGDADRVLPLPATVTKTGALVGTLAYMAPEQFRRETLDARADQFSFCVALHEAIFGARPSLAHVELPPKKDEGPDPARADAAPAWLRAIVSRGLSEDREQRFPSIEGLIRALATGRARPRRRAIGGAIVLAIALVLLGGWRAARGSRIGCTVPVDRLAAVWSGHDDTRRRAIHDAFSARGQWTDETSWQRVSHDLDQFVGQWSAMYVDACEATHIRGEQSGEVLDLRMSCLNDNLDQVRALGNVMATGDPAAISHAVTAAQDLTPISRCADIPALRSAVPLPRDEKTLLAVKELRSSLREAQILRDAGNFRAAHTKAEVLRSRVEATAYGPLLAELLELIGGTALNTDAENALEGEGMLHEALFTAEAAHDDATAARAATDLSFVTGTQLGRPAEAEMWFRLSEAILDRLGPGHERIRAWARNNFAYVVGYEGHLERAERLARQAVSLKEQALGQTHPDVAISLGALTSILDEEGRSTEALAVADRAINILIQNGDPDSDLLASAHSTRGNALLDLGRGAEAEASYWLALHMAERHFGPTSRAAAFPLQGIGAARVLQGSARDAVPFLEKALHIQEMNEPVRFNVAETRFWLARALWESGRNRRRALGLALEAKKGLATHESPRRERMVAEWLAEHRRGGPN